MTFRSRPTLRFMILLFVLNYPVVYHISKHFIYIYTHSFPRILRFRRGDDILGWRDSPCKGLEVEISVMAGGRLWDWFLLSFAHLGSFVETRIEKQHCSALCGHSLGPKYGDGLVNVEICMRGWAPCGPNMRLHGSMLRSLRSSSPWTF